MFLITSNIRVNVLLCKYYLNVIDVHKFAIQLFYNIISLIVTYVNFHKHAIGIEIPKVEEIHMMHYFI